MGKFVKVTGFGAVQKALRELEPKITKKVLRKAMREAMRPVQKDYKASAPVGETKDLKKSIKLRAGRRSRKGLSIVAGVFAESGEGPIAAATEYGTRYQRPQGYGRKTYHKDRKPALKDAMQRIYEGIDKAVKEVRAK